MSARTISVIIPCFNHGQYLDEAVESVFRQTHQDFEILIVDDGSDDPQTRRLLADYERPRTTVERIENRGLPGARNYGIERTEHPFVCNLDADDVLEPTWFERALEVFEIEPDVAFVSHWLKTFGDQEWEWTPERCDLVSLLDMNTVNGAAVVRRAPLLAVGLFDETMREGCEDWDLWLRMVEQGHRGVIVPELLFRYRRRPDSMSRAMNRPTVQLGLFRRLIEQHEPSYREHLLDLLLRREAGICDLEGEIFDLESEYHQWWAPELDRRRAEVGQLRGRLDSILRRQREAEKLARFEHLEADLEGHRKALVNAEGELRELRQRQEASEQESVRWLAEADRLRAEVSRAEGALSGLEQERSDLEADLEGHRQLLHETQADLEGHRRLLQSVQADLGGHRRALGDAEAELGLLRGERDVLMQRVVEREQSLEISRAEVEALRASRSWRWTAPLRALLRARKEDP